MRMWDPYAGLGPRYQEMEELRREIDRLFSNVSTGTAPAPRAAFLPGRAARKYPLINMSDDRDNVYIEALAPGIDPASLDVTVQGNTLTLSGEKKGPEGVKSEAFHRSERAAGRFVRSVELPVEVDGSRVEARYVNGLLSVTLPRAEASRPRQIQVDVR